MREINDADRKKLSEMREVWFATFGYECYELYVDNLTESSGKCSNCRKPTTFPIPMGDWIVINPEMRKILPKNKTAKRVLKEAMDSWAICKNCRELYFRGEIQLRRGLGIRMELTSVKRLTV